MKEREHNLGETVLNVTKTLRHEVKTPENFELARQHLKEGSLIIYLNHFHKLDVPVYGHVLTEQIAPLDKISILAAMKQLDPKRGFIAKFQKHAAEDLRKTKGLNSILVIQDDEKDLYTNPDDFNRKALRQSLEVLKEKGNVLVIAPEGTRSKDGKLQEAKEGMEVLFRLSRKNSLAMPMVLQPFPFLPNKLSIIPFTTNIEVFAGKPFSYDEIVSEQKNNPEKDIKTLMMERMSLLLREQNRGFYR